MRTLKRSAGILALAGLMFGVAGCGGDEGGSDSASPPKNGGNTAAGTQTQAATGAEAEARSKLEACLRKSGIQGIPAANQKLSAEQQQAVQRCGMELIGQANPAIQKQIETMRACLKKRGVKVPDTGAFVPDPKDSKAMAALKACTPK